MRVRHNRLWRSALVAAGMLTSLFVPIEASEGAEECALPDASVPRSSTRFTPSVPSDTVRTAVEQFSRSDPAAMFRYFNCEVDSFATAPKSTVPDYALPVLQRLRLKTSAVAPQLLPTPTSAPKAAQDLDADLTRRVPFAEERDTNGPPSHGSLTTSDGGGPDPGAFARTDSEQRTQPAVVLEPRDDSYRPASPAQTNRESRAATPVLRAFLERHASVFRAAEASLEMTDFRIARYFRRAEYRQTPGGEPLVDGRTVVMFDNNWNVVGISRMLATPDKLHADMSGRVTREEAIEAAKTAASAATGVPATRMEATDATRGIDALRRHLVWQVHLRAPGDIEFDTSVTVHAGTGVALNVSDNTMFYKDAQVRRWRYTDGELDRPAQVIATGQYTRDADALRHDYFMMATDERGGGSIFGGLLGINDPTVPCVTEDKFGEHTRWRQLAYGTTGNFLQSIRHTHRSDRNFSIWSPAHADGSFAESHTYYWARHYMLWMKPTLEQLGVAPIPSAKQLMFIMNACINDGGLANGLAVSIQHDQGESNAKNHLVEGCRAGLPACPAETYADSASSFGMCEGLGCASSPSVIHHEMNHWIMGTLFGISSGVDCGKQKELKFLHEGGIGSLAPQSFWHSWYGVGYNPSHDRLFTASQVRGRVHADPDSRLLAGDYPCVDGANPYEAGRVVGQPLWKIYHGKKVILDSIFNMLRPATDTDFLTLMYWAADLTSASTYQDRVEMGDRFMEVILNYGYFPDASVKSAVKDDWCDAFDDHLPPFYLIAAAC